MSRLVVRIYHPLFTKGRFSLIRIYVIIDIESVINRRSNIATSQSLFFASLLMILGLSLRRSVPTPNRRPIFLPFNSYPDPFLLLVPPSPYFTRFCVYTPTYIPILQVWDWKGNIPIHPSIYLSISTYVCLTSWSTTFILRHYYKILSDKKT